MTRSAQLTTGICCHSATYNTHLQQKAMFESGPVSVSQVACYLTSLFVKINLGAGSFPANGEIYVFDIGLSKTDLAGLTNVTDVIALQRYATLISDGKEAGGIFSWDPSVENMLVALAPGRLGSLEKREAYEMIARPFNYGVAVALVNPATGAIVQTVSADALTANLFVDARYVFADRVL
jgi:hypothetical protein